MKNKKAMKIGLIGTAVLTVGVAMALVASNTGLGNILRVRGIDHDANCEWNHYNAVAATYAQHGSKEFWACCSHAGQHVLTAPSEGHITDIGPFVGDYFDNLDPLDDRYVERLPGNRFARIDGGGYSGEEALLFTKLSYENITNVSFKIRITGSYSDTWMGFGLSTSDNPDIYSGVLDGHGVNGSKKDIVHDVGDGQWHQESLAVTGTGRLVFACPISNVPAGTTIDFDDFVITYGGGTVSENFEADNTIFNMEALQIDFGGEAVASGPQNSFVRMDVIGWQDSMLLYSTAQYTNVSKVSFRFRHNGETFEQLWKSIGVNDTHSDWTGRRDFDAANDGKWHEITVDGFSHNGYVGVCYNMDHVIEATMDVDDITIFYDGGVVTEDFEDENNCLFTLDASHAFFQKEVVNASLGVVAWDSATGGLRDIKGYAPTYELSTGADAIYGPYMQIDEWKCKSGNTQCWVTLSDTARAVAAIETELGSAISNYFFYIYNPLASAFSFRVMLKSSSGMEPNYNVSCAPRAWTKVVVAYNQADKGGYPALTSASQLGLDHVFSDAGATVGSGWKITSVYAEGPVNYYARIDIGSYSSGTAPLYTTAEYADVTGVSFKMRLTGNGVRDDRKESGTWIGAGVGADHSLYTGMYTNTYKDVDFDGEWKNFSITFSATSGYVNILEAAGEFLTGTTLDIDDIVITYDGGKTATENFMNGYSIFTYYASHATEIHLIEQ